MADQEQQGEQKQTEEKKTDEKPAELTPEQMKTKLDELARHAKNKEEEAARVQAKLAKFEKAEADRKTAEMTEQEKLTAKLKETETELAKTRREKLILKVQTAANLPDELAELLQGDDEETLTAHAEKLKKFAPVKEPEKQKLKIDPTNPGNAHLDETLAQKKARLMGQHVDPFAKGGGVNWVDNPQG